VVDRDGPITGSSLPAPLFIAMGLFALRYWNPSDHSGTSLATQQPTIWHRATSPASLFRLGLRGTSCLDKTWFDDQQQKIPPIALAGVSQ
jgi:hypothetical protein